ncbi:MAG: MFS transporter [Oleiphilaceae bacterium]|nr:MFS transporter [Oleiphilaceae bacterium]
MPIRHMLFVIFSLLLGIGILLVGHGLAGTLLSLRATFEQYSESLVGFIMSAYFVGYIFGTFYGPRMINRIGHIRMFAIAAALASSVMLLHGLWVNPWFWLVMRLVYGVAVVSIYLVIESWLNERSSSELRGRVFAVYMLVNLLTLAAGQHLLALAEIGEMDLFAIAAIFFALSLVPVAWTRLPEPGRVDAPSVDLRMLYRVAPLGMWACLVAGLVGGALFTMGPMYAIQSGLDTAQVALFMSATMLGGAFFQWPVGHWSDRGDRRKVMLGVTLLAAVFALASVFAGALPFWMLCASMFGFGGAYFCLYPLSVAHTNDRADPSQYVTLGSSLLLMYGLGATIGPMISGALMQAFGIQSLPVFYVASLTAFSLLVLWRIRHVEAVPDAECTEFAPLVRTTGVSMEVNQEEHAHEHAPVTTHNT